MFIHRTSNAIFDASIVSHKGVAKVSKEAFLIKQIYHNPWEPYKIPCLTDDIRQTGDGIPRRFKVYDRDSSLNFAEMTFKDLNQVYSKECNFTQFSRIEVISDD